MDQHTENKCVLLCARCAGDIGITMDELENAVMLPKPLSNEKILDICITGGFYDRIDDPYFDKQTGAWSLDEDLIEFVRAIEKEHGIK